MKYTYKDLVEHITKETNFDTIIEIDGNRIVIENNRAYTRRYYNVLLNGKMIVTRCKRDNGIRLAVKALNEQ